MGGNLPSWAAAASKSCIELIVSLRFHSDILVRPILDLCFAFFADLGDRLLGVGSCPSPASIAPHSASCASIFSLISRAWSAILCALLSSNSVWSRSICPRRSRFSDSRRTHSFSKLRIFNDWVEFTRAMSRFWRRNFRRTATVISALYVYGYGYYYDYNYGDGDEGCWVDERIWENVTENIRVSRLSVDTIGSLSRAIVENSWGGYFWIIIAMWQLVDHVCMGSRKRGMGYQGNSLNNHSIQNNSGVWLNAVKRFKSFELRNELARLKVWAHKKREDINKLPDMV